MTTIFLNILITISGDCFDIFFAKIALDGLIGKDKNRFSTPIFFAVAVLGEGLLFINNLIFIGNRTLKRALLTLLISMSIYLVLTMLYNAKLIHRLLIVFLLQTLYFVGEFTAAHFFMKQIADTKSDIEVFLAESTTSFAAQIVAFFLLMICIAYWKKNIIKYPPQYHISVLIMPVISFSVMLSLTNIDIYYHNSILAAISLCGLLLINIINVYLLENMLKAQYLSAQSQQLEKQLDMQRKHFDSLTTAYRNTRHIIHDTKKHALYIRSGIEQGKTTELLESINYFINDLELSYIKSNTGNLAIDALVGNIANMSDEKNISFKVNLNFDNSRPMIPDYDICIILGNLLENAYTACCNLPKKQKAFINLNISNNSNKLIIHIVNSCESSIHPAKEHNNDHGFGLNNVANTIDKWKGQFEYGFADGTTFCADVVIPLTLEEIKN